MQESWRAADNKRDCDGRRMITIIARLSLSVSRCVCDRGAVNTLFSFLLSSFATVSRPAEPLVR